MSAARSLADCHDCSQASVSVTRAKGDLVTLARKAAGRRDGPTPALLAEIAEAKAAVLRAADRFAEHLDHEHST